LSRPDVKNLIIEMHKAGIQPATILQVLYKRGTLSRATEACAIYKPKRKRKFIGEWRELCELAESIGGNHHVLTDRIDVEEKRVAVLRVLLSELAALTQCGEALRELQLDSLCAAINARFAMPLMTSVIANISRESPTFAGETRVLSGRST
jgi:hypothetical protein